MGYVIVIEGTDGSGKHTQTEALYNRLKRDGANVIMQSFPNYDSPSASAVKMYLGGEFGDDKQVDAYQASIMYATDRLCTFLKSLKDFYDNGGIIVFDRYVTANILHQAGKIKDRKEVDEFLDWLDALEFGKLKLPRPNTVIYLDVPLDVSHALAVARGEYKTGTIRDIHEEDIEHMQRAYNNGKYVTQKYGWNVINCAKENQMRTIEDIHEEIYNIVKKDLESYMN